MKLHVLALALMATITTSAPAFSQADPYAGYIMSTPPAQLTPDERAIRGDIDPGYRPAPEPEHCCRIQEYTAPPVEQAMPSNPWAQPWSPQPSDDDDPQQ